MRGTLLINWRTAIIFQLVNEIKSKPNPTEEEQNAIKAFNRVIAGTIILCIFMVIALIISITATLFLGPIGNYGDKRYGTVQDDGRIRYTQGTHQYVTQEELGLEKYRLTTGDRVVLLFDRSTEQLTSAYPENEWTNSENKMAIRLISVMVVSMVIFLFYAMFICRVTSWGKDFYLWINTQPRWLEIKSGNKDWKRLPLWLKFVIAALVLTLAFIILCRSF